MQLNQQRTTTTKLVSGTNQMVVVDDSKYLRSYIGCTTKDLNNRITLAWVAFNQIELILKALRPTVESKLRLYNAACVSVLLYGCETWVLTEVHLKKFDVFAESCWESDNQMFT